MSHIYWELHEIPRPEESYINHCDGRVFLINRNGNGKKTRQVIGHATSETNMHPNDLYRYLYPVLWEKYYEEAAPQPHMLSAGMYALTLGIGYATNLYPLLHEAYGPVAANAIMDYACFSILDRSDTSQRYPDRMAHEVLYSKAAFSDTWLSDFFQNVMSEDKNHRLRTLWLEECRKRGVTKAWISIDGSNNDCAVAKSSLPQKGSAKSHTGNNIVSYMYAVNAETGLPITWFVYDGSVVDSKAFQQIALLLKGANIEVSGVILDRGFCTHEVMKTVMDMGYPYVVMMKTDTCAHTEMMSRHASEIRWNVEHCVGENGLFGISDKVKLFSSHPEESGACLYFDGLNGSARAVTLIRKVRRTARELEQKIANGEKPAIPQGMQKYLTITEVNGVNKISYLYKTWQGDVEQKGYSTMAVSDGITAEEADRIYNLRDASETQYSIMKTQLGFGVTHVHSTCGIENKFAVCFIASILRSEIVNTCQEQELDASRMISEMDRITLMLMPNGTYSAINNLTIRQKQLLSVFGISYETFQFIAQDVNSRKNGSINSQIHKLPEQAETPRKRGRPSKSHPDPDPGQAKRKPGRPKGSKNKKTLQKEAEQTSVPAQPKRKPGRPKGSKNKPKQTEPPIKRKRGRPRKDAVNKK